MTLLCPPRMPALVPPSKAGSAATAVLPLDLLPGWLARPYEPGQLRMNVYLPLAQLWSVSGSMYVVTAFGAEPFLMPSIMNCSALTFWGELMSDFVPSSERTLPPAANATSRKSQVRPSYGAP